MRVTEGVLADGFRFRKQDVWTKPKCANELLMRNWTGTATFLACFESFNHVIPDFKASRTPRDVQFEGECWIISPCLSTRADC